ncbi:MAG: ABC transporter permease [Spirochaetales bacterium]|uniref:ABC transporter permease n=1 Tax=Candidatus Thalassospirochaeta sargassi TaxID=3119039 RepID=A0AAJ1MLU1_9SPIO|nr:ABC transporter permease [Spirochaetales bacterium]
MNWELERKTIRKHEFSGISNLVSIEMQNWFNTKKIWFHVSLWIILLFGLVVIASMNSYTAPGAIGLYLNFVGVFGSIGIILSVQGVIIGERKTGIAAWLNSKPISRSSYIISKFFGNLLGFFISMSLIPVLLNVLYISLRDGQIFSVVRIPIFIGCLLIYLSFYLSLTILCGTLFSNRGLASGIPLSIFFAQSLLSGVFPKLALFFPNSMLSGDEGAGSILGDYFFYGTMTSYESILVSVFLTICFLAIAVLRFKADEI